MTEPTLDDISSQQSPPRFGQVVNGHVLTERNEWVRIIPSSSLAGNGYWARYIRRFRWTALGIFLLQWGAVFLIPGFIANVHNLTPMDLFFDLFTFSMQYVYFLVLFGSVINLVVAAYPGSTKPSPE